MQRRQNESAKKKSYRISTAGVWAVSLVVLVAVTAVILLYSSDAFKKNPVLEVFPDNTYEKTLHVVTDIDYEPFSYVDENGNYTGLDVELITEIANRMHMNLDLTLMDWTEANEKFFSGEADAILNMETDLVAKDDRMIATIPTVEKQYVVYGREEIASAAELYGRRVASLHTLYELGLDDYITYVDSYSKIFEGLKNGEYEFAVCPIQVGNVFLEKLGMSDVRPSYAVSHVYGAIALSASDTELKEAMDAVISDMTKDGRMDELDRKWISNRYQSMTLSGMMRSHPWIVAVFAGGFVFIFFLLFFLNILNRNIAIIDRQNEELTEAKERAEASSRAKSTFLFNMSHDIRTPMNAIIGYTNLAEDGDKSLSEMREYLEKIKGSSCQLLALINDVLEMSRIESGKMELEETDANLRQIMSGVRDVFDAQMREKKINYKVDYGGVRHSLVRCDEKRMNRVLLNLVSNAYKFTPEGGNVTVCLSEEENVSVKEGCAEYLLTVEDDGIGMSEDFASKVFEAFERERTSTVSGIQGTGLGMAITKSIVDLMGGSIDFETAPNKGTKFIIRLQLKLREESAADRQPLSDAASRNKNDEKTDFSSMRLLLVEDIAVNREIAKKLLMRLGFTVETAENGQEAVDFVAASEAGYFDAVLMDIQMPVMNGYEATEKIRGLENKELSQIPIIAMTANAFSEDVKQAMDAGMNGHIAKPIDINNMVDTLKSVLIPS